MNRDESRPTDAPDELESAAQAIITTGQVQVFAIFDVENDADLYAQLLTQSQAPGCGFAVTGGSDGSKDTDVWRERVRSRVCEADQVIVICGQHTDTSAPVYAELRIAQDEGARYFLLWGRRALMCTKPIGAKPAEGMFSWTREILDDQISLGLRSASSEATAKSLRNPARAAATRT